MIEQRPDWSDSRLPHGRQRTAIRGPLTCYHESIHDSPIETSRQSASFGLSKGARHLLLPSLPGRFCEIICGTSVRGFRLLQAGGRSGKAKLLLSLASGHFPEVAARQALRPPYKFKQARARYKCRSWLEKFSGSCEAGAQAIQCRKTVPAMAVCESACPMGIPGARSGNLS